MSAITKARFMDGLVLWLPMTEGAGTVVRDQSMYQNNGVFGAGAAAPSWVAGRDGLPSVSFDGGDNIIVPDHASLDDLPAFTYMAFVYLRDAIDWQHIIDKRHKALRFYSNQQRLTGFVIAATQNAVSHANEGVTLNQWDHVAMTYDDDGDRIVRFFIEGMEVSYATQDEAQGLATSEAAEDVGIGSTYTGATSINAIIDDARIYNRVLDPYEIRAHYEAVRKI